MNEFFSQLNALDSLGLSISVVCIVMILFMCFGYATHPDATRNRQKNDD